MSSSETTSDSVSRCPPDFIAARGTLLGEPMPRYDRYVFAQIRPFLKGAICEVGSGTGRFTQFLAGFPDVTAVEPVGALHIAAVQRMAYQVNISHVCCKLEECPNHEVQAGAYNSVLAVNLLEHIRHDITALEIMGELLAEAGHLIVVAPAGPALHGRLDRSLGRLRRYSRGLLADAFEQAGLQVTRHFYLNLPGLLAWWWMGRVLRRDRVSGRLAALADRCAPILPTIDSITRSPIGLSLVMIGKRT
jgi:SAM-dependent methyltransferase